MSRPISHTGPHDISPPPESFRVRQRTIKDATRRCFAKYDVITFKHWHRNSFEFVLPQVTFVESVLHSVSFPQGRTTAQANNVVGMLEVKQRTHYFHPMRP